MKPRSFSGEPAAMQAALVVQILATGFMTGLIWFVQVVHYPLFAAVGAEVFPAYSARHQALTTLVVGPAMLVEAVVAALLVFARPAAIPPALAWAGLALVAVIWLSTALLQVPAHARLSEGLDPDTVHRLVATNWIRTIAWSARAAIAAWMLMLALGVAQRPVAGA